MAFPRAASYPIFASILLGASISGLPTPAVAQTVADEQRRVYRIAPGNLNSVLLSFGAQAGVLIASDRATTTGVQSPGVNGEMTVREGLAALLSGTGLAALPDSGGYRLIRAPATGVAQLEPVTVTGRTLEGPSEATGSYTVGPMATATRLPLTMRETPQAVTVVTRQRMDDQAMTSLNDVVENTPGLLLRKVGTERSTFYARGFQIDNLMYDGMPTSLTRYTGDMFSSIDLAIFDRIEVVRGATGLMQGAGNPSAAINMVRKRPTATPQLSMQAQTGSWDNYRADIDAAGPLNDAGSVRGRVVTAYQKRGSFQDVVENERNVFYAVGEVDVTRNTLLTVGAAYQKDNNDTAWGGLPVARDGSDLGLKRSTYLGTTWDHWNQKNSSVFGNLDHQFDNGWKLKLAATAMWSRLDFLGSYPERSGEQFNIRTGRYFYSEDQNSVDLHAQGPVAVFGREHDVVVGAGQRQVTFDGYGGSLITARDINVYDWNPDLGPMPNIDMKRWRQRTDATQQGVYAGTRLNMTDRLKTIVGARLDWYDADVKNYTSGVMSSKSNLSVNRNLTRYAGVVYDLDQHHSVYGSYTDIFKPQSELNTRNDAIAPIKGQNYEVGVKGEYLDGRLNASAAVFRIDQNNRAKLVSNPQACASFPRGCYEAAGKVRSEGVDLEINGQLTPNWQVGAGYTYSDPRYRRDSIAANVGKPFATEIPRHLFKLATTYRLPDEWNRWRVGGNVYWQSKIYSDGVEGGVAYHVEQKSYALVGLMVGYAIDKNVDLQLNVNNVLDKKYYKNIVSGWIDEGSALYGDPRSFMLSLSGRW